jgi:hypothetical protein
MNIPTPQELLKMSPGKDLDKLLSKLMAIEPLVSHECLSPDGKSTCFSGGSKREVEEWRDDLLKRLPDSWVKEYHFGTWQYYPQLSSLWQEMKRVLDLFDHVRIGKAIDGVWSVTVSQFPRPDFTATGGDAPEAVCKAAILSLLDKKRCGQ